MDNVPLFDGVTGSTIMCNTHDDDDCVGNTSFDTFEVYGVNDDDIKFRLHRPKIIPKNETPPTICTVNTTDTMHSK